MLKIPVLYNATLYGIVYSEAAKALCHLLELLDPEDEGTRTLRNVGLYLPVDAA